MYEHEITDIFDRVDLLSSALYELKIRVGRLRDRAIEDRACLEEADHVLELSRKARGEEH